MMSTEEPQLRAQVERVLGETEGLDRLHDDVWHDLELSRWPDLVARRARSLEQLAEVALTKERLYHPPRIPRRDREVGPDARLEALGQIIAAAADRWPRVVAFRRDYLGGRTLGRGEAREWLRRQRTADGGPSVWLALEVCVGPHASPFRATAGTAGLAPHEALRAIADRVTALGPVVTHRVELALPDDLARPDDSAEDLRPLFVSAGGVLEQLGELARDLCADHVAAAAPWPSQASAVDYVLTGRPPRLATASVGFAVRDTGLGAPDPGSRPPLAWIRLGVNPRLASNEVRDLYASARSSLFGSGRDKPMTDKHLRLALFAERSRFSGLSWPALRAKWNSERPRDAFSEQGDRSANRFARDCRSAWSRVTGARWPGLGGPSEGGDA